jgi:hypothetical protein
MLTMKLPGLVTEALVDEDRVSLRKGSISSHSISCRSAWSDNAMVVVTGSQLEEEGF